MLHGYVPSGNGRDNFIFNDTVYKHGKVGTFQRSVRTKGSHVVEFWEKSEKKCSKLVREPPTQPLKFDRRRKIIKPKDPLPSTSTSDSNIKAKPIVGYSGHRQGVRDVHGKSSWTEEKRARGKGGGLSFPSFRKADVDRVEQRMGRLKQKYELDKGFQDMKECLPVPQKKLVRNVVQLKYIAGYGGHQPIFEDV